MTAIMERPAPRGSTKSNIIDQSNSGTEKPLSLKIVGRPRKLKRDQSFTVFLDNSRLARLEAAAAHLRTHAVKGQGMGKNDYFRSAAVRELLDKGWPAIEATSERGQHKNVNIIFTVYMNDDYLGRLNDFVNQVEQETGKKYSRSSAVRDLIDTHLWD